MTNFANLPKSLLESATLLTEKSYNDMDTFQELLEEYGATDIKQLNEETQEEIYVLLESMGIDESYVGFAKLKAKIGREGGVSNPGAVAAAIGRKKYGKKKFQDAAAHHHKMKNEELYEDEKSEKKKPSEKMAIKNVPPISKVAVKAWQVVHAQQRGTYGKKTGLKQEEPVEGMKDVKRNQMDEDVGEGPSPDPASGLKEGLRGDDQHETHSSDVHHPKFEMKTEEASGTESSKRRKQHSEAIRKITEKLSDTGLTAEDKSKARTELNFHKQQIKKLSGVVKKEIKEEPLELFKDRAKEIAEAACSGSHLDKKKGGHAMLMEKPDKDSPFRIVKNGKSSDAKDVLSSHAEKLRHMAANHPDRKQQLRLQTRADRHDATVKMHEEGSNLKKKVNEAKEEDEQNSSFLHAKPITHQPAEKKLPEKEHEFMRNAHSRARRHMHGHFGEEPLAEVSKGLLKSYLNKSLGDPERKKGVTMAASKRTPLDVSGKANRRLALQTKIKATNEEPVSTMNAGEGGNRLQSYRASVSVKPSATVEEEEERENLHNLAYEVGENKGSKDIDETSGRLPDGSAFFTAKIGKKKKLKEQDDDDVPPRFSKKANDSKTPDEKDPQLDEAFMLEVSNEAPNLQRLTLTQENVHATIAAIQHKKMLDLQNRATMAGTEAERKHFSERARHHHQLHVKHHKLAIGEESLDELSKETMSSYNDKAHRDVIKHPHDSLKRLNRLKGIQRSYDKNQQKDEEALVTELSREKIEKYTKKANRQYQLSSNSKTVGKRKEGLKMAGAKLHGGETRDIGSIGNRIHATIKKAKVPVNERSLTPHEDETKENNVHGMKKHTAEFKKRYGDRWKSVIYATATKQAKNEEIVTEAKAINTVPHMPPSGKIIGTKTDAKIGASKKEASSTIRDKETYEPLPPIKGKKTLTGDKKDTINIDPIVISSPSGTGQGQLSQTKSGNI